MSASAAGRSVQQGLDWSEKCRAARLLRLRREAINQGRGNRVARTGVRTACSPYLQHVLPEEANLWEPDDFPRRMIAARRHPNRWRRINGIQQAT